MYGPEFVLTTHFFQLFFGLRRGELVTTLLWSLLKQLQTSFEKRRFWQLGVVAALIPQRANSHSHMSAKMLC